MIPVFRRWVFPQLVAPVPIEGHAIARSTAEKCGGLLLLLL